MSKKIGQLFVERGLLTEGQVRTVVEHSKRHQGRFGESVVELGYLSARDLRLLLGESTGFDFLYVEASDVSETTRNLFPFPFLAEHGFLPLGFEVKTTVFRSSKVLRIGMTQPGDLRARLEIEQLARELLGEEFGGIKIYLILTAHFETIFRSKYKTSPIEATLSMRVVDERAPYVPMFKDEDGCQMMHLAYREEMTPPSVTRSQLIPETGTKSTQVA